MKGCWFETDQTHCLIIFLLRIFNSDKAYSRNFDKIINYYSIFSCFLDIRRLHLQHKIFPSAKDRFLYRMSQMKIESSRYKNNDFSVGDVFAEQLKKNPNRDCIYFEGKTWKAIDVEEYSNRVANVFQKAGYKRGDVVSLLMGNRPEYVCIWLGLSKIGVITALINTNLKKNSLLHCFLTAKSKAIIFSESYAEVVKEIEGDIPESMTWYRLNDGDDFNEPDKIINLKKCLEAAPVTPVSVTIRPSYKDHLMYIFTSGTTGMPKAAVMPHSRYLLAGLAAICLLKLTKDDIIYNPLPMYHTAGGALGIGAALMSSTSVVIRPKFSASNYFSDCVKYKCTIGQYIGEMCRYILATPVKAGETNHRLRLMIGNGMRASIWSRFVQRFQIPQITEVYGATEGNVNICNLDNTIGAIGCFPKCLPQFLFPIAIIKVDEETGQPCRNKHGFCERCDIDEPGMLVGLIKQNDPTRQFHGYVDSESSKKKTIENVFKKGDRAFVSGK
ncbi:long-chain fatty acid transport protein 4 isoform X1 [Nilaparvata lugens]|uniref:long-chain fatty acid transport protein 4 isoform X1 n=1 Tax=Nilaparvata lugens TaxID=108931 RepID=UPI00193D7EF6|nr:long-chain fatty acid transport protein 4 isoform X1 [Nilaparvata lugens]